MWHPVAGGDIVLAPDSLTLAAQARRVTLLSSAITWEKITCLHPRTKLIFSIKADLELIHSSCPTIQIMWPDLLERQVLHGDHDPQKVAIARQKVTRAINQIVVDSRCISFGQMGVHILHWEEDVWLWGYQTGHHRLLAAAVL